MNPSSRPHDLFRSQFLPPSLHTAYARSPPCPIFLHRNCTCNAHADAYITIINFHPAFPASTINSSVSYHNACDKQRKTRYKLYHYFQKFVGVRRFRGFWSTFCGLRFKTVRCIVQRSSWSESSPISNMRIFLGQTTVQKGYYIVFCHFALAVPLVPEFNWLLPFHDCF